MVLVWEDGNLLSYQTSMRYLNPRLRWNYFRFRKTDGRHFGFIFPVSIFAQFSSSACHSALAYHISSKSNNPWHSYDVISISSRWRPAAMLDLIWITLDYPRSAIVGLRLVLKFGLHRIHSFGDIVIFIFCSFGLKLPIHAHFWGVLGAYFHQMTSPSS